MTELTPDPVKCEWCGGFHENKCPLVKAFEYHPDGAVKQVEFYEPLATAQQEPWWHKALNARYTS